MNDWKLIVGVVIGSVMLVILALFGLSKMQTGGSGQNVDINLLTTGAKLIKGKDEAKVKVVVFSDVQCPACKRAHGMLASLGENEKVQLIYRYYPLITVHQNAVVGARAAEAAREMGKGWEMVQVLFDKQEEWQGEKKPEVKFVEYAGSLGLDKNKFTDLMKSETVVKAVDEDTALGDKLLISGTPTVYVNGELVAIDFVADKVKELIK